MVAPVYTTDLALITDAGTTTGWSALGSGGAGLNDETDYYIEGTQCVSKNGWTGAIKGMIFNAGATTIDSNGPDAVFVWSKQNNRNLLNSQAAGGVQVLIGNTDGDFNQFYVDGDDSEGSTLAGWRNYAVDPTATASASTGSPTAVTSWFGVQWSLGGSGTLKGAPNAIDVIRHGRELRCTDGDGANGYATFDGAASFDADITRSWGLLTPSLGGYLFHGHFVMGQSGTPVDFRDSNRVITVLEDPFVASTFNEMSIVDASSNVQWTNIQIAHLGTTSPTTLNLNVGTFTGVGCRFDGCGTTTFSSGQSCQSSTWANSGQVVHGGATLNNSTISGYTGAANSSALLYNVAADPDGEMDGMTFEMGSTATHAIEFGTTSPLDITLRNCTFNGFNATGTNNQNDSTFHVKRTTGTVTINLVGCSTDATDFSYRTDGATVVLVVDPVTTLIKVIDANTKANVVGARVLVEADTGGPLSAGTDIISGITDANGEISDLRTFASNQPIVGKVRRATSGTLYKQGDISGTIDSTTGFSTTVQLIPDE